MAAWDLKPGTLTTGSAEAILAGAPLAALIVDPAGAIHAGNARVAALFGTTLAEVLRSPLRRFLAHDEAPLTAALLAADGALLETVGRRLDGAEFPLEATVLPCGQGRAVVLLSDATAKRENERSLRYKEALLASQHEAAVDGILIVDADSRVVSMNRRFLEMWDVPRDLMKVGGSDEAALRYALDKLEDPSEFLEKIEWLFDHPRAETRDEVRFKDGRVFERWSSPVLGPDAAYYGRGWYFRDITDRKQREVELQEALARAKEAEAFRRELVRNVSHDLASPLTPIRLQLHMLQESLGGTDPRQTRAMEVIGRNLDHIKRLVDDLRDVALLEGGQFRLDPKDVDLASVVTHVAESFQESAKAAEIALATEVQDALPARVDPTRIAQVLFNLVTNAIKFTPKGGTVTLAAHRIGNQARIEVRDTGRGLLREEMDRLFRPFGQVHKREEARERGTGLGLYISRGLVERHGGRIWVESEGHGKGSTFVVTLPLAG